MGGSTVDGRVRDCEGVPFATLPPDALLGRPMSRRSQDLVIDATAASLAKDHPKEASDTWEGLFGPSCLFCFGGCCKDPGYRWFETCLPL